MKRAPQLRRQPGDHGPDLPSVIASRTEKKDPGSKSPLLPAIPPGPLRKGTGALPRGDRKLRKTLTGEEAQAGAMGAAATTGLPTPPTPRHAPSMNSTCGPSAGRGLRGASSASGRGRSSPSAVGGGCCLSAGPGRGSPQVWEPRLRQWGGGPREAKGPSPEATPPQCPQSPWWGHKGFCSLLFSLRKSREGVSPGQDQHPSSVPAVPLPAPGASSWWLSTCPFLALQGLGHTQLMGAYWAIPKGVQVPATSCHLLPPACGSGGVCASLRSPYRNGGMCCACTRL